MGFEMGGSLTEKSFRRKDQSVIDLRKAYLKKTLEPGKSRSEKSCLS